MTPSATVTEPAAPAERPVAVAAPAEPVVTDDDLILADLLVEEISIDGMCGVY